MKLHGHPKSIPRRVSIACQLGMLAAVGTILLDCGSGSGTTNIPSRQLISISVQPNDAVAFLYSTVPFSANGTFDLAPTTQMGLPAQWTSSDTDIATLDVNRGVATCVAVGGPITVTASDTGQGGMVRGTATLTCGNPPPPSGIGNCLLNRSNRLTGSCRINSCQAVSDPVNCPAGQQAHVPISVVGVCIPGPPMTARVDRSTSCGP
jgi:hypothetical protein